MAFKILQRFEVPCEERMSEENQTESTDAIEQSVSDTMSKTSTIAEITYNPPASEPPQERIPVSFSIFWLQSKTQIYYDLLNSILYLHWVTMNHEMGSYKISPIIIIICIGSELRTKNRGG